MDLAKQRIWQTADVRMRMRSCRDSCSRSIRWQPSLRSLTGKRSAGSARARRARPRASPRSFLDVGSPETLAFAGFATMTLKPSERMCRSIHRQCVPVSKATGQPLSNFARHSANPASVVAHVVSATMRLSPDGVFAITQIFDVLSLTSTPIVVQYSMSVPFCLGCSFLHLPVEECVATDMIPNGGELTLLFSPEDL